MSTCQWKQLRITKINARNYSHLTWRPTFYTMTTKVSQTASWVPMHLLPWAQHKKWIPIGSLGCSTLYIKDHTFILCKILSVLNGRIASCGWFCHFSPKPVLHSVISNSPIALYCHFLPINPKPWASFIPGNVSLGCKLPADCLCAAADWPHPTDWLVAENALWSCPPIHNSPCWLKSSGPPTLCSVKSIITVHLLKIR
jgi:hypothetical protein